MYPVETINQAVGIGALVMQVLALAFLVLFFLRRKYPDLEDVAALLGRYGLWIGLALTLSGVVISLFYSEILGFVPCSWCWFQRIFMYSQAVLFAVAIAKNDTGIAAYSIALSVFGLVIGLYNHYLQVGGGALIPCPASGGGDCAQRFLFELGYITFPLVGVSAFALLIVVMLFVRRRT